MIFLSFFEEISHESVRIYHHRHKKPRKRERTLIAIDETKLKLENNWISVWTVVDVDTKNA